MFGCMLCQAYRNFIIENGVWLIALGTAVILGFFAVYQRRGVIARRRFLEGREAFSERKWFETFYPVHAEARDLVGEALRALGRDIGTEWTRLRPTDTFEQVLRVQRRYSPIDDLEEAELEIALMAERLGILDRTVPGFTGTLKDFLDRLVASQGTIAPETARGSERG